MPYGWIIGWCGVLPPIIIFKLIIVVECGGIISSSSTPNMRIYFKRKQF